MTMYFVRILVHSGEVYLERGYISLRLPQNLRSMSVHSEKTVYKHHDFMRPVTSGTASSFNSRKQRDDPIPNLSKIIS